LLGVDVGAQAECSSRINQNNNNKRQPLYWPLFRARYCWPAYKSTRSLEADRRRNYSGPTKLPLAQHYQQQRQSSAAEFISCWRPGSRLLGMQIHDEDLKQAAGHLRRADNDPAGRESGRCWRAQPKWQRGLRHLLEASLSLSCVSLWFSGVASVEQL
jgi:hypothetical protein